MTYSLQQKRNSPYYFCVFHVITDGRRKQVWKSTKCRNIDDAHERAKDILAEYNTGYSRKDLENMIDDILSAAPSPEVQKQRDERHKILFDRRDAERKKEELHFDYIIDDYIPNVIAKTKSLNFCKAIKLAVRKLKKYSGVDNVHDLDRKVINDFKLKLLENGQKTNAVILILNCISGLLKSLYENNYLDKLTRINSGLKKIENDNVYTLEDDEFETILEYAYNHDYNMYLIFLIQGYTGLRISEVVNSRWEWFQLKNDELYLNVRNAEANEDTTEYNTKNRKNRMVFVPKQFFIYYNEIKKDSGYILEFKNRYTIQQDSIIIKMHFMIDKFMKDLMQKNLIQHKYTSHDFRRYFATRMYKKGTDLYFISKQLGHSNVTTTERYLRLDYLARNSKSIKF